MPLAIITATHSKLLEKLKEKVTKGHLKEFIDIPFNIELYGKYLKKEYEGLKGFLARGFLVED